VKYTNIFKESLGCNSPDEVFDYFKSTLNSSITYWDYFVNWEKVLGNVRDLEIDLNTLNYLIGKEDMEKEFKYLFNRQPSLIRLIPILLACREANFKILTDFTGGKFTYEDFTFKTHKTLSDEEIDKAYRFADNAGILSLFRHKTIKNVVDYVIGVEVGLDSNGRKNRGGTTMERIVEGLLKPICERNKLDYMTQATAVTVKAKWGINLRVDKSTRRFDFAIRRGKSLCIIETNYYGGGGSKLKATAGEYKALYNFLSADGHKFIWITDGAGWESTLKPLEETFNHIDYTLNLNMVCKGVLENLINELKYA